MTDTSLMRIVLLLKQLTPKVPANGSSLIFFFNVHLTNDPFRIIFALLSVNTGTDE